MSQEQNPNQSATPGSQGYAQSPWSVLREAREARGLSTLDVAQHLKLTPRQIEAMEAGDLASLPGPAFARGFLRNYARFLKLDPALFHDVLDVPHEASLPVSSVPLAQMPGNSRWPSVLPALAVVLALLLIIVAGWYFSWFEPREEKYLAEVVAQSDAISASAPEAASKPLAKDMSGDASRPQEIGAQGQLVDVTASAAVVVLQATSAPVAASSAPATDKPASGEMQSAAKAAESAHTATSATAAAVTTNLHASAAASSLAHSSHAASSAASSHSSSHATSSSARASSAAASASSQQSAAIGTGAHKLAFSFAGDSWVEIRDAGGKVIYSHLNTAGSSQTVNADGALDLVIGNAAQVKLTHDGKPVDITPPAHSSVRRIHLP